MKLSYAQKEQFFHELTESLRSGRSLPETLERKAKKRVGALPALAKRMVAGGGEGSVKEYFDSVPEVFSDLDLEMVVAGAAGGRLESVTRYLASYYESLARVRRRLIAGVMYPVVLLHFAAVVFSIPVALADGPRAFAWSALGILFWFYVGAAVIWVVGGVLGRAARNSPAADRWLMRIPVIGGVRVALVGSRFCQTMSILVRSGGGVLRSLDRAGAVCGSAGFERGATETTSAVRGGEALGDAIDQTDAFPDLINRAIETGEQSGRLDDEMERLGARYEELLKERLESLAAWLPKLVYIVIAVCVGWWIVQFYLGYLGQVNALLDGM